MTSIKLTVQGAVAAIARTGIITAGMVGIPVTIEYDETWEGLTKTVVFQAGKVSRSRINVENSTTVAPEVLEESGLLLLIGVEGRSADGTLVIRTVPTAAGKISPSLDPSADPSIDPEPPIWAQLLGMIGGLEDLTTETKTSLVAAVNELAAAVDALEVSGGGADPEEVQRLVEEYLEENPPEGGVYILSEGESIGDAPADAVVVIDPYSEAAEDSEEGTGTGISLGVSGASVGQVVQIAAVDENGVPTAWEPVEMVSGGAKLKLAAEVTTTENVAAIAITGLALSLPVSFRIYNPGSNCGGGMAITVNGESVNGYFGSVRGTDTRTAQVRGWLFDLGGVLGGRCYMANGGINTYRWADLPETIESIELKPYYNDGEALYCQAGTIVEIYEGVYPNVE